MATKKSFFDRPSPIKAPVQAGSSGIPRQRASFEPKGAKAAPKRPKVDVPADANPDIPWEGVARYARYQDAMRRLEEAGFEENIFGDEMVCLDGRFVQVVPLDDSLNGPCELRVRRANLRPRPGG